MVRRGGDLCLLQRTQTLLLWLLNPWIWAVVYVAAYAAVRVTLLGFVDGFVWLVGPRLPALPSRTGPKPVFQHTINTLDVVYLVINSVIEFVFTQHLARVFFVAPYVLRAPSELGMTNSLLALWLLLVIDDMLYAPLHRFMHHPSVYRHGTSTTTGTRSRPAGTLTAPTSTRSSRSAR